MNEAERTMLEELKKQLKKKLHKDSVDAYLQKPGSASIVKAALENLEKATNEAAKP